MSIIAILLTIVGVYCFLFFFWNRLKEDYTSHQIFSVGFLSLIGILSFYLITRFLILSHVEIPGIQESGILFYLGLIGGLIGFIVGLFKFSLRFFESFEALIVGYLYLALAVFVADTFISLSIPSLIGSTVVSLLITFFYFLETKYKNFTWYRSGKVGFSGLATIGFFFLIRAIVALKFSSVLTFLGRFESLIAAILTFLLFFGVYNLSARKD
ncbi:hypothetical protein KW795_01645 [Candidatus Microgenomates bacterium]|nr:hypothetical protein [Candidatus Microgenomates bacterium]